MRISKSLAATVAALSLGGGALALVAPAAQAAAPPAGADVVGTVLVNGAPAVNEAVTLYGVNADLSTSTLGTAYTDSGGQYYFDFDSGAASSGTNDSTAPGGSTRNGSVRTGTPTQGQFKVRFLDDRTDVRGQLAWETQYSGAQPTLKRAIPVTRTVGGVTTVPTAALAVDSGIGGTVSLPPLAGYYYSGAAYAYNSDDQLVSAGGFNNDPTDDASNPLNGALSYEIRDLYPGGTYHVQFFATASPIDPNSTADDLTFIGSFYGNSTTFADAKDVTTTPGAFTGGIDGSLTNVLQTKVKPSIKGQIAPGKKVKADPGTWNLTAETTYTYQWLLNGKLVSTDDSYKLPKKAKKSLGKKLQLVVTAQDNNFSGTVALRAEKVKYAAALKGKPRPAYVGGKRVVQLKGVIKLKGVKKKARAKVLKGIKVTVYEVDKKDDTVMVKKGRAKVNNGQVVVSVKGLISGKHTLEVVVTGKKIADIVRTYTVKV